MNCQDCNRPADYYMVGRKTFEGACRWHTPLWKKVWGVLNSILLWRYL